MRTVAHQVFRSFGCWIGQRRSPCLARLPLLVSRFFRDLPVHARTGHTARTPCRHALGTLNARTGHTARTHWTQCRHALGTLQARTGHTARTHWAHSTHTLGTMHAHTGHTARMHWAHCRHALGTMHAPNVHNARTHWAQCTHDALKVFLATPCYMQLQDFQLVTILIAMDVDEYPDFDDQMAIPFLIGVNHATELLHGLSHFWK